MCGSIESDSALFFMFRQQKNNNKTLDYNCPFDGVHTFSYSTRHGNAKCSQPPSHIDSCMDKTKMVFKFQACPDVPGSESSGNSIIQNIIINSLSYFWFYKTFERPYFKVLLLLNQSHHVKFVSNKCHNTTNPLQI